MNIKTPLRVDEKGGIFDADGFVFIHHDSFGTGGQHHGDDERIEFQVIRAREIAELMNRITRNICDTCEKPYLVNANFDKHC